MQGQKGEKSTENNEYITIQEVWGQPEITTSTEKNKTQDCHKSG